MKDDIEVAVKELREKIKNVSLSVQIAQKFYDCNGRESNYNNLQGISKAAREVEAASNTVVTKLLMKLVDAKMETESVVLAKNSVTRDLVNSLRGQAKLCEELDLRNKEIEKLRSQLELLGGDK